MPSQHTPALCATPLKRGFQASASENPLLRGVPVRAGCVTNTRTDLKYSS